MACFLVSAAEAVVVTAVEKAEERKEKNQEKGKTSEVQAVKIPLSRKLKWLTWMLWGGAVLLAFEHIWHGEIIAQFPFLTAASDPGERAVMLREMATVGVGMTVLVTLVWLAMVAVMFVLFELFIEYTGMVNPRFHPILSLLNRMIGWPTLKNGQDPVDSALSEEQS